MSHNAHTYQYFRTAAKDTSLTLNERCGFPEEYRAGRSEVIFADISSKLTVFGNNGSSILDIGAGCSDLTRHIIETTATKRQSLSIIDCPEMLELLPSRSHLRKIEGPFPDCLAQLSEPIGPFDAILAYSVVQMLFVESNLFGFVDAATQLLAQQGQLLIGDIPNATMRKRLLASAAGKAYHKIHYGHLPEPDVVFNALAPGEIDDGVVLGLVFRMRAAGFQAFVVPQAPGLPMANRREDILIVRP